MLTRLTEQDLPAYRALLDGGPVGLRIAAALDTYGPADPCCAFFRADHTGALCVEGALALLCGVPGEMEELEQFLALSGVQSFFSGQTMLEHWLPLPRLVLRHPGGARPQTDPPGPAIDRAPDLWALCSGGLLPGEGDALYRSLCRRAQAGRGLVWAVRDGGEAVSAAAVTALDDKAAYLAALATAPAHRGKGCAAALVRALCAALAPRDVLLICEPALRGFYEGLGFSLVTPICAFVPPPAGP